MTNLIIGIIVFVLCFLIRLLVFTIKRKSKKGKQNSGIGADIEYLVNKFNLDYRRVNTMSIAGITSFVDAFIIALTLVITTSVSESIFIEMILGLVLVLFFIVLFYEAFGRILVKKGFRKDE